MMSDSKYSLTTDFFKLSVVRCRLILVLSHLEYGQKRFLRDLDAPDALHALLAFLLFLQEFALARDVAAIALGEHVLPHRLHAFARDDAAANRRLNRDLEQLPRNELAHL